MFYVLIKKSEIKNFKMKQFFMYQFVIALIFLVGFVVGALFLRFINSFIVIEKFIYPYGFVGCFIFAGYLIDIPYLHYLKDVIIPNIK